MKKTSQLPYACLAAGQQAVVPKKLFEEKKPDKLDDRINHNTPE
jgi:hypothetical protein